MDTPHFAPVAAFQIARATPARTTFVRDQLSEIIRPANVRKFIKRPPPTVMTPIRELITNPYPSSAIAADLLPVMQVDASTPPAQTVPEKLVPVPLPIYPKEPNDFAISGWLLLRPSAVGRNIATAGQLGGSQVGARVTTRLASFSETVHVLGFIRGSTALSPISSGEGAIGVSLRHTGTFVSEIQVERRVKLSEGGRNDFALVTSTSLYSLPLTRRMKLAGYAQAGIVGVKAKDLFIDGSLKLDRNLIATEHGEVSVGVGVWAAAQPDVSRVDVGPHVTVKQRLGKGAITISGEWRFQLAGNAKPASGPAISAGFDF